MTNKKNIFRSGRTVFFSCFLLANLLLSSWYIDIWCTPNAVSRALPVLTLLHDGTLKIDPFENRTGDKSKVGDHFYSDKAPFPTLATVPFYWLAEKTGLTGISYEKWRKYPIYIWKPVTDMDGRDTIFPDMIPLLFLGSLLLGSIPFALMVFWTLKRIPVTAGSLSPVLLVMMSFYGSFFFVFAGTYFNHIITAFLLLAGYILIREDRFFWSGVLTGLSFISEYPVAVVIPLWMLVIWIREKSFKKVAFFGLGTLPAVLFILVYNYLITGHPGKMLVAYHAFQQFQDLKQNYGFRLPSLESLWGLSFGTYMGIFPYVPVLLLCAYFLIREWITRFSFRTLIRNYLFMFSVPFFLAIASFFTWWGGWSYGPRYLVCLAVILVYEGILFLSGQKIHSLLFFVITGFGVATTWIAKVTLMYMIPDGSGMNGPAPGKSVFKEYLLPAFTNEHFNANNLLTLGFGAPPAVAAWLWLVFFIAVTWFFTAWFPGVNPSRITIEKESPGKAAVRKMKK